MHFRRRKSDLRKRGAMVQGAMRSDPVTVLSPPIGGLCEGVHAGSAREILVWSKRLQVLAHILDSRLGIHYRDRL